MPIAHLESSPLAGGRPTTIAYRAVGRGAGTVLFLHGGWGYEVYPFTVAADVLAPRRRVVIPDRSGYGGSTPIDSLPLDFHRRAVTETCSLLDALEIDRAVWWGHSDGAVIAALAAIERPERVEAIVLEAVHLYKDKPASRAFFQQMATNPDTFGPRLQAVLRVDHGDRWEHILKLDGAAWLGLAASATRPTDDLYDGRLGSATAPALLVHGDRDPRTEPGELDAVRAALPHAVVSLHAGAGHSPHSETASAEAVAADADAFLQEVGGA